MTIQQLWENWRKRRSDASVPNAGRRAMLAGMAAAPLAAIPGTAHAKNADDTSSAWQAPEVKGVKGPLPKGKIGGLEFSRLILGTNLINGYAHARDLVYAGDLFRAYNTKEKIYETLSIAEQAGIDTVLINARELKLFDKARQEMGTTQKTMVQVYPNRRDWTSDVDASIDSGASTMYVQGAVADKLVRSNSMGVIEKTLAHIKDRGFPAGVGAHSIQVPMACEKAGLDVDYYVKTCHHDNYWSAHPKEKRVEFSVDGMPSPDHNEYHDNIFDLFPEQTAEFMQAVEKPWVGFKVLAGGAIHPKHGFPYAFQAGADFICVGMFDWQIVDDVNLTLKAIESAQDRDRPWRA